MPFPDPTLVPPTLTNYQFSYRGLTFGGVTYQDPYQLMSIPAGLDGAAAENGDVNRPLDQGEFIGLDNLPGMDITIQLVVIKNLTSLDNARQALGGIMGTTGGTEYPLYIQLPSGTFAAMVRPRKYNFAVDVNTLLAGGAVASLQFHATDPRWYRAPTKRASSVLPGTNVGMGGVLTPVTTPIVLGGGTTVGGVIPVYNNGLFEMRPVLTFVGPLTNPTATNLDIENQPVLGFNIVLAAGDTLTIDTDFQSVALKTAGSTVSSSRRNAVASNAEWWNIQPGLNRIRFGSSSSIEAGTLIVDSADAWTSI